MATLTNAKAFKGILQVKSLPATPEKGYIYLVGDGTQGGNGTGIYFGTRYYGKTENSAELINLKNSITANTKSIEDIEAILGEWKENFTGNLATVAQAVVAVSGATEANTTNIATLSGTVANNLTATTKAIADAKSELLGDAGTNYNTLGKLEDEIQKVAQSVTNKNVSATGDTYVSASAEGNTVTVAATTALTEAVEKANSAVQTVAEGVTKGTIAVDGKDVAVYGLGSAAYTEASAYDPSGAAATVKSELLGGAADDYNTLGKLEDKIQAVEAAAKSYSVVAVTGDELTALGANVKEAYKLVDEDSVKSGEYIKIYKDSALQKVELDGQELVFTYLLATGAEDIVRVDVSNFLAESEFKDGLQVVDHVVSVKVDSASESFLTVGTKGIKLNGVQDAIDAGVASAKTHTNEIKDTLNAAITNLTNTFTTYTGDTDTTLTGLRNDINDVSGAVANHKTETTEAIKTAKEEATAYTYNAITAETSARTEAFDTLSSAVDTKVDKTTYNTYTSKTDSVLESIKNDLTAITSNAVTSIASTGKTITVVNTDGKVNVEVNTLAVEAAQASGYVALETTANGELYGVMYYGGDDAE